MLGHEAKGLVDPELWRYWKQDADRAFREVFGAESAPVDFYMHLSPVNATWPESRIPDFIEEVKPRVNCRWGNLLPCESQALNYAVRKSPAKWFVLLSGDTYPLSSFVDLYIDVLKNPRSRFSIVVPDMGNNCPKHWQWMLLNRKHAKILQHLKTQWRDNSTWYSIRKNSTVSLEQVKHLERVALTAAAKLRKTRARVADKIEEVADFSEPAWLGPMRVPGERPGTERHLLSGYEGTRQTVSASDEWVPLCTIKNFYEQMGWSLSLLASEINDENDTWPLSKTKGTFIDICWEKCMELGKCENSRRPCVWTGIKQSTWDTIKQSGSWFIRKMNPACKILVKDESDEDYTASGYCREKVIEEIAKKQDPKQIARILSL
ncbi:hypothetical protein GNI_015510 [Gregarina niphandrodes]|uniref:Uncharacterized protein n=1 Tax=Gregarina niphandrodes TaxID=110365 RepID=A0A023BCG2_GRENI|nr:hypothetical protein GNI_015510 [Gregarina niphandrodes]EZG83064.1 hypothetical protein GNI_015510 [Gregarina niphandrodes]|eukprot:XP_011128968.1 hypothetical protein GNI_015510 [Gregarina niphandrodes]